MDRTRRAFLPGAVALAAAGPRPASAQASAGGPQIVRLRPAFDDLVAPGQQVARVATGFTFVEGPMWRRGRLWFSDLGADRIMALDAGGGAQVLLDRAGGAPRPWATVNLGPNAMAADRDGSVLLARQGGRTLVRLDDAMRVRPFLSGYEGRRFNSPTTWCSRPTAPCGSPTRPSACRRWRPIPQRSCRSPRSSGTPTAGSRPP